MFSITFLVCCSWEKETGNSQEIKRKCTERGISSRGKLILCGNNTETALTKDFLWKGLYRQEENEKTFSLQPGRCTSVSSLRRVTSGATSANMDLILHFVTHWCVNREVPSWVGPQQRKLVVSYSPIITNLGFYCQISFDWFHDFHQWRCYKFLFNII